MAAQPMTLLKYASVHERHYRAHTLLSSSGFTRIRSPSGCICIAWQRVSLHMSLDAWAVQTSEQAHLGHVHFHLFAGFWCCCWGCS